MHLTTIPPPDYVTISSLAFYFPPLHKCVARNCILLSPSFAVWVLKFTNSLRMRSPRVVQKCIIFHIPLRLFHSFLKGTTHLLLNVMEGTHKICYPPTFVCPNNIHSAHAAITSFNIVDSDGVPISLHS